MAGLALLRKQLNETQALQAFQLLRYGSAILVSILLAKSVLTQAEIASYEYLLYLGTTLSFFWVSAFITALIAVYPKLNREEQSQLLFQAFGVYFVVGALLCSLLFLCSQWLVPFLTNQSQLPYLPWFLVFLFFNFPTHLIDVIYLFEKRPGAILGYGVVAFFGYLIALVIPVWAGWGLGWGLKAIAFLAFIRFLWLLLLLVKKAKFKWPGYLFSRYLSVALPLVGYTFMGGFAPVFDNWLVGWYYQDPSIFAIFRYGARELPLALALTAGLSTSLIPVISAGMKDGLRSLKSKSRKLYHWLFPFSILLVLSADWLFPVVFNSDFSESAGVFKVYLLLVISRVLLPTTVMHALEETKAIFVISVFELMLNIVLSLIFIPIWGMEGVAFATVLAFLFEKVGMMIYLKWKYGLAVSEYMDWQWLLGYVLLLLIAFWWQV